MLKSALVLAIAALLMRSTRALFALLILCSLALMATLHVTTNNGLTIAESALTLLVLDLVGSFTYVLGVTIWE